MNEQLMSLLVVRTVKHVDAHLCSFGVALSNNF